MALLVELVNHQVDISPHANAMNVQDDFAIAPTLSLKALLSMVTRAVSSLTLVPKWLCSTKP